MANNNNEGVNNNPDNSKDSGSDKSFVGKVMSGIINSTPLSKWFGKDPASGSIIQRREEDEFDVSYSFQPPTKRAKLPTDSERNSYSAHIFESPVTVHASNNVNNVSSKVFEKFPEPLPGPSGIRSRKLLERHNTSSTTTCSNSFENQLGIVNGDPDSDSEESTSGYSSAPKLVSKQKDVDKEITCEKTSPKARSLFTPTDDSSGGRTLFASRSPQMNTSLSSRRPMFNASTFGSPNFVDRTLSTKRIMNSPFYNGQTVYGGASAYSRRLGKSTEETRTAVQIKPANEKSTNENMALSKTARRILSTLEQYSTPIRDAKKIPVVPRKPGLLTTYVGATPYLVRDRKRPSNKELQVPSVPDLLQMKQRERLQNTTESVRQIAAKSKSTLNKEQYKLRTEEDSKQKYSNKMKNSITSVRQKGISTEPVSDVKLPKVSLPITILPKFDFVLAPPSHVSEANKGINNIKSSNANLSKPPVSNVVKPTVIVEKKETASEKTEKVRSGDYIFSEPLVISPILKSVKANNCFKFSEPLCKKQALDANLFKPKGTDLKGGGVKLKYNGENTIFAGAAKAAGQLTSDNVIHVLTKKNDSTLNQNNTTVDKTIWECPTCLVKNDASQINCCACDEPKPQSHLENHENKRFGDQFKLTSDKWECSSCLVRNSNLDKKCVACAAARTNGDKETGFGDKFKLPASMWECSSCLIRNKNDSESCAACGTAKLGKNVATSNFGDKFKPSGDTWECTTCMIRNKNDLDKCAACETAKPGLKAASLQKTTSFTSNTSPMIFNFGIKSDWECKTCLIRNKNELTKCAACEAPKENAEKVGFGDDFKVKVNEWECGSCMVRNKSTADACVCCGISKPGNSAEKLSEIGKNEEKKPVISFNFGIDKSNATQFKFGIPTSKTETTESSTVPGVSPAVAFGDAAKTNTVTTTSFTFGVNSQEKVSTTSITPTATGIVSNPLLKPDEKLPEKTTPAPAGFKFGIDSNLNKNKLTDPAVSHAAKAEVSTETFSNSFGSTSIPTFQFKPAAINGELNKPTDNLSFVSDSKSKDNVSFGGDSKPKDGISFGGDASKPNIFGGDMKKSKDTMFGTNKTESQESPFGTPNKSTESPFVNTSKPTDSLFGNKTAVSPFVSAAKPIDSSFGTTTKPTDSPFGTMKKPTDSPFSSSTKPAESPFGKVNKPSDSPFGNTSKPPGVSFGNINKPVESRFSNVPKPMESPFGNMKKPPESPFITVNKPTELPFANVRDTRKPKESLFGVPNDANKSQHTLFSNVNEASKPQESVFSSGTNKSKDIMFGGKPTDNSNLFTNPTSVPPFTFTPKPSESGNSTFPSATASQPAAPGIFTFGSGPPPQQVKKPFGGTSDNNISNGFGSGSKLPAFGTPQAFGSTDNKPFAFGNAEPATKSTGFSFSQAEKPNAAAPIFNFGGGAPNTTSAGFNFSVPSTGFNFGNTPKVETQPFNPPSSNVFGAAGTGANGSFNFGTNATNNNQKAVFSFGANQTTQPSQPNFPTQNTSGFNFGTPASLSAPGSFNFTGAPSTFNFTDGNSTQNQPQRKIKKALRRTHR